MAKQPSDAQHVASPPRSTAFSDLTKAIAERNELAHKEARELRATREQKELGISARHRLDLDR